MICMVRKQFGEEISDIVGTCDVGGREFPESHAASDPTQVHVNAFRFLDFEFAVGKANGALIVSEDGGGGLGVAEVK